MAKAYYCTGNDCYKEGNRLSGVEYLIVHSPAVYPAVIRAVSGSNNWYKRWNKPGVEKLVHGFIDDTGVYEFAPPTMACWQIGDSWGNKNCIGYELCELDTREEFEKMWENAAAHYAALCEKNDLPPERVIGHYEAHEKGFASDHSDPAPYFKRFGRTMEDFRSAVRATLGGAAAAADAVPASETYTPWAHGTVVNLEKGDLLNVRTGPGVSFGLLPAWPKLAEGNEVDVLARYENGWARVSIRGAEGYVNARYLDIRKQYAVWVGKAANLGGSRLNVRTGPGTGYGLLSAWPKLSEGNLVDVTGESEGWYQVRIAGKYTGWVSREYVIPAP